jgi:hypothetical protein
METWYALEDIKKLWDLRDNKFAVQVVKHDYKTKIKNKYWGNKNEDYPKKKLVKHHFMELRTSIT